MRDLLPSVLRAQIRPAAPMIGLAHYPANVTAAANRARLFGRAGRAMARFCGR